MDTRCYIQDDFFANRLRVGIVFLPLLTNTLIVLYAETAPTPSGITLFFRQILVFGMATDIFTHKPAQGPDLQTILSGIIQTSLNQLAA